MAQVADGRALAPVAAAYAGERGLSPLGRRVRPGASAAPNGLQAGRSGSVRRAAGQHDRARARERGGRALKERAGARPRPEPGRLPHPDSQLGGSTGPSLPAPTRDGRPASRPHSGPSPRGSLDERAAVLPDRGPGLWLAQTRAARGYPLWPFLYLAAAWIWLQSKIHRT